jgi:hypothetical protein
VEADVSEREWLLPGFLRQCSICADITELACTDCAIDHDKLIYVCVRPACRDAHELFERLRPTGESACS